jgi:molecular chaperone DnaK
VKWRFITGRSDDLIWLAFLLHRGVPQIEVTFDIDANGIVHVSAKDLGTGKEQKIRIESSSGLSETEIEQMLKDGEAHAEEDQQRKETVEVRNRADSLVYGTEKSLQEFGDKVSEADRNTIESAIQKLKESLKDEDIDAIRTDTEALLHASHKLAEVMYSQAATADDGQNDAEAGTDTENRAEETDSDETIVDVEGEDVEKTADQSDGKAANNSNKQ